MKNDFKKFWGFTLSEVLITIGIIGIVSALTLPDLMLKYQQKSMATLIKKTANQVSQAARGYMLKEKLFKLNDLNSCYGDKPNTCTFIEESFSGALKCKDMKECWGKEYYINRSWHDLDSITNNYISGQSYILPSGVSISARKASNTNLIMISLDANGKAKPNKVGQDFFVFHLNNDGALETGSWGDCNEDYEACLGKLLDGSLNN